ncbi:OmpH family outer membrane protein [Anatilimnocola floriformis]|uniref:OmpH family outer membrane protein n=1 Tax=Anatilimnocola floriformis TaxID=2948575 RepID=UPI0020C366B8|nr:OmpH family outer membrane protein [Anatilimnocola floriformis]
MKVCFPATFVAGVMFCLIPAAAFAQVGGAPGAAPGMAPGARPPAAAAPAATAPAAGPRAATPIVVIDIAKVFKGHYRFNQQMGDIKKDIEDFDGYVKNETNKLKAMGEALQSYRAGSLEYKQKEEEAARLTSDLQVKVGLKKKELLENEARVYFNVYRDLEQKVAIFAQQNQIMMVLRFNSDEMKEDDRNSVLQGVNRAVVYYNPGLDVTQHLLVELNRGVPPYNPPAPAGGATGPQANNNFNNRPQIPGPNGQPVQPNRPR